MALDDIRQFLPKIQTDLLSFGPITAPPGQRMRIRGFNFDLQTGALAGERFVGYEITDPEKHTFYEALTPPLSTPEKLYGICGFVGAVTQTGGLSRTILLPLPDIWLPPGWAISYINLGKQVGDSFPLVRTIYETFPGN